ncbi:hypothetical protein PUN28_000912 [Cardiocondyla obscurior]|uniref:Uncharacterized protein n=1 Tax=Cardiocondyla obscurior TaxID=286306 RepID=A0AAW2H1Q2_9HYME
MVVGILFSSKGFTVFGKVDVSSRDAAVVGNRTLVASVAFSPRIPSRCETVIRRGTANSVTLLADVSSIALSEVTRLFLVVAINGLSGASAFRTRRKSPSVRKQPAKSSEVGSVSTATPRTRRSSSSKRDVFKIAIKKTHCRHYFVRHKKIQAIFLRHILNYKSTSMLYIQYLQINIYIKQKNFNIKYNISYLNVLIILETRSVTRRHFKPFRRAGSPKSRLLRSRFYHHRPPRKKNNVNHASLSSFDWVLIMRL